MRWMAIATLVLLVGGVGFAMHERKSALEGRLGTVATELGSPARARPLPELRRLLDRCVDRGGVRRVRCERCPEGLHGAQAADLPCARAVPARVARSRVRLRLCTGRLPGE